MLLSLWEGRSLLRGGTGSVELSADFADDRRCCSVSPTLCDLCGSVFHPRPSKPVLQSAFIGEQTPPNRYRKPDDRRAGSVTTRGG